MTSIRTRITSAVVGCTALVVAIAALAVGTTAHTMLERGLDERLLSRARWVGPIWRLPPGATADSREGREREGRDKSWQPTPEQQQQFQQATYWLLYQSCDVETGEELQRSQSMPKDLSLATFGMKPGEPIRTIRLPDGRPFRLLAISSESVTRMWPWSREARDAARENNASETPATPPVTPVPPERRPAITWLAADASDIASEGRRLAWILAAVWAGATVLAFAASVKLSGAVLKPVGNLSRTIESLAPTGPTSANLSARVAMTEVPAELSTVVSRLNALLEKLESAFRRERATIANMAHELRNPISALRTTLEFGLYNDLTPQGRKTLESSLALALRMQSLVNGLLTLTRIEAGQEVLAREEVDVVHVLREAWGTIEARANERGITASWSVPESLRLVTSPAHVELVAANLLDNAVSHGAAPGAVEIVLDADARRARLRVTNDCKNKVEESGERAGYFEPFWRSDPARSGARHFGLGLALCDRVVRLLGGTIEAHQKDGRFTVTVELPAPTSVARDPALAA